MSSLMIILCNIHGEVKHTNLRPSMTPTAGDPAIVLFAELPWPLEDFTVQNHILRCRSEQTIRPRLVFPYPNPRHLTGCHSLSS